MREEIKKNTGYITDITSHNRNNRLHAEAFIHQWIGNAWNDDDDDDDNDDDDDDDVCFSSITSKRP